VQAQQPRQPAAPQGSGVPDGIVVEAPGQGEPGGGAGQVVLQGGRNARQDGRQLAEFTPEDVLRQFPVPVHRLTGIRGESGEVRRPFRSHCGRMVTGQFLGQPGTALQQGVQRRPRSGDPRLQPAEPGEGPTAPRHQEEQERAGQQEPGLGRHGTSG
jgi:hypothetical protein